MKLNRQKWETELASNTPQEIRGHASRRYRGMVMIRLQDGPVSDADDEDGGNTHEESAAIAAPPDPHQWYDAAGELQVTSSHTRIANRVSVPCIFDIEMQKPSDSSLEANAGKLCLLDQIQGADYFVPNIMNRRLTIGGKSAH